MAGGISETEKPGWVAHLVLGLSTMAFAIVLLIEPTKTGIGRWAMPMVWFALGSYSVLRSRRLRLDKRARDEALRLWKSRQEP